MRHWERYAPLAGAAFGVLFAVGLLVSGSTPGTMATGEEVISHYDNSGKVYLTVLVLMVAAVLFMFFGGILRARLRDRGTEWLASAAFGGAVLYTVGLAIFGMTQIALVDAADLGQGQVAQALNVIDNDNFLPTVIGLAVILLATACHIFTVRPRSMPGWLGWASLALGLLALAGPAGFVAFLLFPIWAVVVSVLLYRHPIETDLTLAR
jgi:hypothetical protein